jgi:hypothetical protein
MEQTSYCEQEHSVPNGPGRNGPGPISDDQTGTLASALRSEGGVLRRRFARGASEEFQGGTPVRFPSEQWRRVGERR